MSAIGNRYDLGQIKLHEYKDPFAEIRRSVHGDKDCLAVTTILVLNSTRPHADDLPRKMFLDKKRVLADEKIFLEKMVKLNPLAYSKLRGMFQSNLWCRLDILEAASSEPKWVDWLSTVRKRLFGSNDDVDRVDKAKLDQ